MRAARHSRTTSITHSFSSHWPKKICPAWTGGAEQAHTAPVPAFPRPRSRVVPRHSTDSASLCLWLGSGHRCTYSLRLPTVGENWIRIYRVARVSTRRVASRRRGQRQTVASRRCCCCCCCSVVVGAEYRVQRSDSTPQVVGGEMRTTATCKVKRKDLLQRAWHDAFRRSRCGNSSQEHRRLPNGPSLQRNKSRA